MANIILVSTKKYYELKAANSALAIAKQHSIKQAVEVDGISYCITSVQQNFIIGYRIVMRTNYTGALAPLTWTKHEQAIKAGTRPRSHDGLMLHYGGAYAVLAGEYVRFEMHRHKLEQLSMF